jgi:single-stranded DNA-binding protein
MNSFNFTGRLTNDPIRRDTTKGVVATFRVAADKPARFYIDVDAWGQLARVTTHLTRRRHVAISGRYHIDEYHDRNGDKRHRHFVIADQITFLDSPTLGCEESQDGPNRSAVAAASRADNR